MSESTPTTLNWSGIKGRSEADNLARLNQCNKNKLAGPQSWHAYYDEKVVVLAGFTLIALFSFVLFVFGLVTVLETNAGLHEALEDNHQKLELMNGMHSSAQERMKSLQRMLIISDNTLLAEELDQTSKLGGLFASNREKYLALELSEEETSLMQNLADLLSRGSPLHQHIVDLILFDDLADAQHTLLNEALPLQRKLLDNISKSIDVAKQTESNLLAKEDQIYSDLITKFWAIFSIAALLCTGIIIFTLRLISKINTQRELFQKSLEDKVSERTDALSKARSEAETLKQQAQSASYAKSEFLSSMSHELRTPMNTVLGFSELLIEECNNAEHMQHAQLIHKAGSHLLELINDILDLSKIEAGKMTLNSRHFNSRTVLSDSISLLQPLANQKAITLDYQKEACNASCFADPDRLRQCMINLISNAIKYNQSGGKVQVGCHFPSAGQLRITVEDDGQGIPKQLQDKLFDPFNRLGAEGSNIQGSGIGLSITQKMIEMMGGQIGFESIEGQGSKFWLEIAASPLDNAAVTGAHNIPRPGDYAQLHQSHTLLYIEDNPDNMQLMKHIIKKNSDATLLNAKDAETGIKMARSQQPDLILLDINLPGMDGYEAIGHLKNMPETSHIPVIAVSANAMQADIDRAIDKGFDAYITKPVSVNSLFDTISQHLPS